MVNVKEFGVKSKNFETYKKFKQEVGKLGIRYLRTFTPFNLKNFERYTCLWFGKGFDECSHRGIGMSLSNPEHRSSMVIDLDVDYNQALEFVKEWYELYKPKKQKK